MKRWDALLWYKDGRVRILRHAGPAEFVESAEWDSVGHADHLLEFGRYPGLIHHRFRHDGTYQQTDHRYIADYVEE